MNIYGTITDKATGETLPMANIYFSDNAGKYTAGNTGTTSDNYGYYQLSGDGGFITASYTGFNKMTIKATPGFHNFELTSGINLPEVEIKGKIIWPRALAAVIVLALLFYLYKKFR